MHNGCVKLELDNYGHDESFVDLFHCYIYNYMAAQTRIFRFSQALHLQGDQKESGKN